jgi:hypothetical protein
MNNKQPTLIKNLFADQHSKLDGILKQAANLEKLNTIFQNTLNSELARHCYLVESEENSITLIVDNASWATALRYNTPDIVNTLKSTLEFKALRNIRCKLASKI